MYIVVEYGCPDPGISGNRPGLARLEKQGPKNMCRTKNTNLIRMSRPVLFTLLLSFLFTACLVRNTTKGKKCPDTCNKNHKLTGKKVIVRTSYGKLKDLNTYEFPYAKQPYPMGCVIPVWPVYRLARIYVCDSCTKICRQIKDRHS